MAHNLKFGNVKHFTWRFQQYCRLSSTVERSQIEPFVACTLRDRQEGSCNSQFSKRFFLDIFFAKLRKRKFTTIQNIETGLIHDIDDLGLPVAADVSAGYPYLHWGNVDTYRSNTAQISSLNDFEFTALPNDYQTSSLVKSVENDEITDWLIDYDQAPFNECSSFYGKTASETKTNYHNQSESAKQLIDDTHFDGTNFDSKNEDDIILRDVEDYKVRVDKSVLDSNGEESEKQLLSHVLKSSIKRISVDDFNSLIKSDLNLPNNVKFPDNSNILQFSSTDIDKNTVNKDNEHDPTRPTREQLLDAKEFLLKELPNYFKKTTTITKYNRDVVLENNFFKKPTIHYGISKYIGQMIKIRTIAHIKYSHLAVNILSVSTHEDTSEIKVRWQVAALSQWTGMFMIFRFWKFLPHNYKKNTEEMSRKYDGISTFTIGRDGLVHRHRVDRVIPDEQYVKTKKEAISPAISLSEFQ